MKTPCSKHAPYLLAAIAMSAAMTVPAQAVTPVENEIQKILASDGALDDQFGLSVALDGDIALIGAIGDDDHGNYSGSAYVFRRVGSTWIEEAKLTASDGAAYDQFGRSVALDGDTAVIGARGDGENGDTSGSAYVFRREGSDWVEEAKLTASDGAAYDLFGTAVALDGDTAVIGAIGDADNGLFFGSAYVFQRVGNAWIQEAKLTASDASVDDQFGRSLAVDGDTAVIGSGGSGYNAIPMAIGGGSIVIHSSKGK